MTLRIRCTHERPGVDEEIRESALRSLGWVTPPPFERPGRTAWIKLADGRAIKLKGVGLWNPKSLVLYGGVRGERSTDDPIPPSTRGYEQKANQRHFGFDDTGLFMMKSGAATPSGGMLHAKAIAEYENGIRLKKHNVPSILPIMVVEYSDLRFQGQNLGAVASLSPDQYPFGLEAILFYEVFEYPDVKLFFSEVGTAFGIVDHIDQPDARFATIGAIYEQVGSLCRQFSEAGLFRHSGGLNNFYFCRLRRSVFMTDLDSSLLLRDIPIARQGMEILRDLVSAIHKMFLHFAILQCRRIAGLDALRHYSILAKLLKGYFDDIAESRISKVAEGLVKIWTSDFVALSQWRLLERVAGEIDLQLRRDWFYIYALLKLSPLFIETRVGRPYRTYMNSHHLLSNARSYLGEEFAAFCSKAEIAMKTSGGLSQ